MSGTIVVLVHANALWNAAAIGILFAFENLLLRFFRLFAIAFSPASQKRSVLRIFFGQAKEVKASVILKFVTLLAIFVA